jgi:hypothetical protein
MPFWPFKPRRHVPPSSPSSARENSLEKVGTVADSNVEKALAALLETQSTDQARRLLEDRKDVLLSEQAEQLLYDRVTALSRDPDANDPQLAKARTLLILVHTSRIKGIDAAFKPIDDQLDRSNRALAAFINAPTWTESRRILEEQQDVLLDEATLVLLRQASDAQRLAGNEGAVDNLELHLSLLEQARSQGLAAALDHIDELHDERQRERQQDLVRGLAQRLLQDPEGLAAMRLWLAQYQVDPARGAGKMPEGFGDFDDARLAEFAEALSQAVALIDARYPEIGAEVDPEVQQSLNALFVQESLEPLTRPEQMPQRIALIDDALRQIDPHQDPRTWALLHGERGNSWLRSEDSNLADRVAKAIADFDAALTIVTPEFDRDLWAVLLMNRAAARAERTLGDRRQQLELALADCEAALTVFSPTHDLESWANALMTRANLYQVRIAGDRAQNLEQALADATDA